MDEKKKSKLGVLIVVGIIVFAGFVVIVNLQQQIASGAGTYQIKNFGSYDELTNFLVVSNQNIGNYRSGFFSGMLSASPTVDYNMVEGAIATKQGGTSVDYSKTNVQVPGVDEPDIVKTDGTYLYIVSYNNVTIVKAYPAQEAAIISKITFNDSLSISNIFIDGARLVVFTETNNYPILYNTLNEGIKNFWYSSPDTYVKIYDLTDISSPVLKKDIVVGGSFSGARLIGDYVYVITTQYSYTTDENQTIVPELMVDGKTLEVPLSDIYYVDIPEKSSTLTNIVSVNIHNDSEEVHQKIFLLGTTQTLYVSEKNIYVTYSTWYYDYPSLEKILDDKLLPMLPDAAKTQLDTVKTLNLEDYQKQMIAQWIIQNYVKSLSDEQKAAIVKDIASETEKTIIHRISIDAGEIKYEAQGTVIGYVKDQFSLSEYNGYLRVSTTLEGTTLSSYLGSVNPQNNVYVLDMDLKVVGSLEGIATGESIYATRFVDNICYLVTFRQIDPFFVIDLSDPTNPQVLGQLKIPGYSTYLHPYDETHIIGVGRDGSKVKISLFDVSDMSNPIELSNYSIEGNESGWWWSDSSALYEHKAFLFDKARNLLVIPAGSYNKQLAYVFNISVENGISLKGTISHDAQLSSQENGGYNSYYYYDDGNSIQRTLYIDNVLYTISKNMVKMNNLDDLSEINSVTLV